MKLIRRKKNAGFTLLEYVAGAAIMAGIVFTAFNVLGTSLAGFMEALATWANERANGL